MISGLRARARSRETERAELTRAASQAESDNLELRERIAQQWADIRATRRAMDARPEIAGGPSNLRRGQVPYGVDLAAAWAWRFLVISLATALVLWLLNYFLVVVLPVVIALLIAALATPVVAWAQRIGVPRKLAALVVVVLGIGFIALLVTFVGNQVSQGVGDLGKQVADAIDQIRLWLRDGPLHVTDSQISSALDKAQQQISGYSSDAVGKVTEVGTAVGHVVAGIFIVLFATYFFLADGPVIWAWLVRLFPGPDGSGRTPRAGWPGAR